MTYQRLTFGKTFQLETEQRYSFKDWLLEHNPFFTFPYLGHWRWLLKTFIQKLIAWTDRYASTFGLWGCHHQIVGLTQLDRMGNGCVVVDDCWVFIGFDLGSLWLYWLCSFDFIFNVPFGSKTTLKWTSSILIWMMDTPLTSDVFSFLDTRSQGRILCSSTRAKGLGDPHMLHWFAVSNIVCGLIVGKGWSNFSREIYFLHLDLRDLYDYLVTKDNGLQVMTSQCLLLMKLCKVLTELGSYQKVFCAMDVFHKVTTELEEYNFNETERATEIGFIDQAVILDMDEYITETVRSCSRRIFVIKAFAVTSGLWNKVYGYFSANLVALISWSVKDGKSDEGDESQEGYESDESDESQEGDEDHEMIALQGQFFTYVSHNAILQFISISWKRGGWTAMMILMKMMMMMMMMMMKIYIFSHINTNNFSITPTVMKHLTLRRHLRLEIGAHYLLVEAQIVGRSLCLTFGGNFNHRLDNVTYKFWLLVRHFNQRLDNVTW